MSKVDLLEIKEIERKRHLAFFVSSLGSIYTTSLFLIFSLPDFIWFNSFFIEFFEIRILVVTSVFISKFLLNENRLNLRYVELISAVPFLSCSAAINWMIFRIGDSGTVYWAGLAIIVSGLATGFRFSWRYYFSILATIITPFIFILWTPHFLQIASPSLLNLIFLLSISFVATSGRWFFEKLTESEFDVRQNLAKEIELRDSIIKTKTDEAVRLFSMSKQFSPQILEAIKSGSINFSGNVHRTDISAIFVDIKDSTVKFVSLDRDDVHKVISMYMDDVMGTFLKFDITIDKFLGDGVLGFSNDPVKQSDFIERTIFAAHEIRMKILLKQDQYVRYWGSEFQVRIGISTGYASVGFYGSDRHVKSYTAIGKVVNLCSRVNGIANPNEVTISQDVLTKLQETNAAFLRNYQLVDLGTPVMKGFESEKIKIYSILPSQVQKNATQQIEDVCPSGHGALVLAQLQNGIYVMKCKYCDFILEQESLQPFAINVAS